MRTQVGLYFDIFPSLSFRCAHLLALSPRAYVCVCRRVYLSLSWSLQRKELCITQCNGILIRRLTFPFHKALPSDEFGIHRDEIPAPGAC